MRRTIAAIGRTLVTLGLLILLFVGYQLWGTGIYTAQAQDRLKDDFKKEQAKYEEQDTVAAPTTVPGPDTTTLPSLPTTPTTQPVRQGPPPPTPPDGEVEGLISIPAIGLKMAYVEGTSVADLRKGPGHYPETPVPGSLGNAAIAGHRTTYLHPFFDIDKLKQGDEIIVATLDGKIFTYAMYDQIIVKPTDTWVVDNTPDAQLTLTSCNPKYSAAQRIVTKARLVANKSAKPEKPKPNTGASAGKAKPTTLQGDSLARSTDSLPWAFLWGVVVLAVGVAWWWAFRRWRHPATWVIGVIPFLIVLFPFYVFLERSIPQGVYSGVSAITRRDVADAAARIAPFVDRTPVVHLAALDEWIGAETFVKADHLQRIGAFKLRGATNAVQSLSDADAACGVAAHSSGNHAAALALAARTRGIPAYVVMPEATPEVKRAAVEGYGAQIMWSDNTLDARRAALAEVLTRTGATEIHPYDDPRVIAGAGTAALELLEDVPDVDVIVTPIGGGGLCSGTCIAAAPRRAIGGQPVDRSATMADGLRTGTSPRTEQILREHVVDRVPVSEAAIAEAIEAVWQCTRQLIEPSAAVAFAAARMSNLAGERVAIISSGANTTMRR